MADARRPAREVIEAQTALFQGLENVRLELKTDAEKQRDALEKTLGRMHTENQEMLQNVMNTVKEHSIQDDKRFEDQGKQIAGLTNWRHYILGGIAVIGVLGALVAFFYVVLQILQWFK